MKPHRLSIKFFVADPATVDLQAVVPVFHRWIQQHSLEGLLIDVADYKHMVNGPGIILIGHEADYALDLGDGRPGLLYTRKRDLEDDLSAVLRSGLRQSLTACRLLEQDDSWAKAPLVFRTDEIEVKFLDRLHTPNRPETLAKVRGAVEAALAEAYPHQAIHLESVARDPRQPLTLRITAADAPPVHAMLDRLQSGVPVAS